MRQWQLACQESFNAIAPNAASLLGNSVVHAPLDFEEDWRVGAVFVKAEAKFKSIFVAIDRGPIKLHIG
jgi:hypothetical protein